MVAIVVLAAGASSRLGKPKQNLVYKGQTLLQRMIESASATSEKVIVVLGDYFNEIKPTIIDTDADIIINKDWALGMSSSINKAVSHILLNYHDTYAILFTVCDQPYVNTVLLQQLIETANASEQGIIACSYNDAVGVPVLFKKNYFPELLKLNGTQGAKKIIKMNLPDVFCVPFPEGSIDIDTEEDFNDLVYS